MIICRLPQEPLSISLRSITVTGTGVAVGGNGVREGGIVFVGSGRSVVDKVGAGVGVFVGSGSAVRSCVGVVVGKRVAVGVGKAVLVAELARVGS